MLYSTTPQWKMAIFLGCVFFNLQYQGVWTLMRKIEF